jgi:ribose transport system permease protein
MGGERVSAIAAAADTPQAVARDFLNRFGLLLVVLLMMGVLTVLQPQYFLTRENLTNIARQVSSNAVLALGQFVVVVTAGIDLSVGSVMGLSMIVVALTIHQGWPSAVALLLALCVGLGVGRLNGLALTRLHLPHPFIATLATLNIARGATYLLSGGVPISGLTPAVRFFGAGEVPLFSGTAAATSVPVSFLIVILLYVAVAVFMTRTPTGRHIYAIGGSPRAAQYAGINVNRILTLVYTISGGLAGAAGILLAGRVNSGYPTAGTGAELDSIAAVIIGGASFFGGRGTASGVFFGAIIMGLLRNGLNLMNVSVFWQQVFIGCIILLAVYVDVLRRRAMRLEG